MRLLFLPTTLVGPSSTAVQRTFRVTVITSQRVLIKQNSNRAVFTCFSIEGGGRGGGLRITIFDAFYMRILHDALLYGFVGLEL